jgi:hypothetical protein
VTDKVLTLSIDNKKIASVQGDMYSTTDEIEFGFYNDQNTGQPIQALSSDFRYTPL